MGSYSVTHSFSGADGGDPHGILVFASDGNFYGITGTGGALGYGTVFRATTAGAVTTLHSFDYTHGSGPKGVIQGTDGTFYGTTNFGGVGSSCFGLPCGVVYKITTSGRFTLLHNFNVNQGLYPGLPVQASNGTLYGMTLYGGLISPVNCPIGCGTLYSITPNGTYQTIHKFQHSDGGNSFGALVQATDGNLYGESPDSADGFGQVFKLALPNTITEVTTFNLVGMTGGLTAVYQATDGN